MSEHIRPEACRVPHEDVEVELVINGVRKVFSTADSAYWVYPERYKVYDHLVKWLGQTAEYELYFGLEQVDVDALHEAGITRICAPYPNEQTQDQWWYVEMADFENEMAEFEKTGDLPKGEA